LCPLTHGAKRFSSFLIFMCPCSIDSKLTNEIALAEWLKVSNSRYTEVGIRG